MNIMMPTVKVGSIILAMFLLLQTAVGDDDVYSFLLRGTQQGQDVERDLSSQTRSLSSNACPLDTVLGQTFFFQVGGYCAKAEIFPTGNVTLTQNNPTCTAEDEPAKSSDFSTYVDFNQTTNGINCDGVWKGDIYFVEDASQTTDQTATLTHLNATAKTFSVEVSLKSCPVTDPLFQIFMDLGFVSGFESGVQAGLDLCPSSIPTGQPSSISSSSPSSIPTGQPSSVPTAQPSSISSSSPSSVPTAQPSSISSSSPSSIPTGQPSSIPSSVPTAQPSSNSTTVNSTIVTGDNLTDSPFSSRRSLFEMVLNYFYPQSEEDKLDWQK